MSDQFDDDLADALQSRAGTGTGSTTAAHDAVLARAGHIRRRRAAVGGGLGMLALLIGGLALLPRGGSDSLAPSETGDIAPSVETGGPAPTVGPDSSLDSASASATPTSSGDDAPGTTVVDDADSIPTTAITMSVTPTNPQPDSTVTSEPTTTDATDAPGTTVEASTTAPSTSEESTTTVASSTTTASSTTSEPDDPLPDPFTRTYTSSGGSITVDWDGASLSLLSVAPEPGFESEVKDNTSTRLRVEFDDGDSDSRIEVRLDGTDIDVTIS